MRAGQMFSRSAGPLAWLASGVAAVFAAGRAEAQYLQPPQELAPYHAAPSPHYGHGNDRGGYTDFSRSNGIPAGYGLVPPGHGESYNPRCKAYRQAVWVEPNRWAYQRIRYCK